MINDFYDDSEPIVKLDAFYGPKKNILDKCLVTFSYIIYHNILDNFECELLAKIGACSGDILIYSFNLNGEKIAFFLCPIGSAIAANCIAELNHLTGATKFVMFGSCGTLAPEITKGKFIVPTEAYRGEGLSYYFAKPQDYIKIKNSNKVSSIFAELNIPFVEGKVWTTDCMLRETVNLTHKRIQEGCIGVEMELAGVESICDYYNYDLYNFLESGDAVVEGSYEPRGLGQANHNLIKLEVALEILKRIQ